VPDRPGDAEVEAILLHVLDHADHGHPRTALARPDAAQPFADRIFARPGLPDQLLADHHDRERAAVVVRVEQATFEERYSQGLGVSGTDHPVRGDRHFGWTGRCTPLDLE